MFIKTVKAIISLTVITGGFLGSNNAHAIIRNNAHAIIRDENTQTNPAVTEEKFRSSGLSDTSGLWDNSGPSVNDNDAEDYTEFDHSLYDDPFFDEIW